MKREKTNASTPNPQPEREVSTIGRRTFVKSVGLGSLIPGAAAVRSQTSGSQSPGYQGVDWPTLKRYDSERLEKISMPIGGIGTGTVSLAGTGGLRDWEVMNRPAKGFVPRAGEVSPCFILFARTALQSKTVLLEGPVPIPDYEGSHGSRFPNENLPRFASCQFDSAYPFGRVTLSDPELPLRVEFKAFNPLIPGEPDPSGIPLAVLCFDLVNITPETVQASVCGTLPNFIGIDGWRLERDWKGDQYPAGADANRIQFRDSGKLKGLYLYSEGVNPRAETWGTLALTTLGENRTSHRQSWAPQRWGTAWLDFWDDFSSDGRLQDRPALQEPAPIGSLAVETAIPPGSRREVLFLLTWHFPNRYSWTRREEEPAGEDWLGNYYTTQYRDAWDVAQKAVGQLQDLRGRTAAFVQAFLQSPLPEIVKEAALFNISTLRTQTCFRTPDGHFFGWEGTGDNKGCCHGSCTHVWNYEQATAFLFGELARSMREVEFLHATNPQGMMSFRVNLPLSRAQEFGKAAADGQLGCIMKCYRDWTLSGDDDFLKRLWPQVKRAVEFCWIEGGWDADRDGVMEGCQHNTMDVEYYGPNPQMGIWYLGALRASEEMARYLGDSGFSQHCRQLYERGSQWIDGHLFNGSYYEHQVKPPGSRSEVAPSLLVGMGASDPTAPEYQLARGCLVDQLVGQFMAHVCGLGYLTGRDNVRRTLRSIREHNRRENLRGHFNCMRTFALADESALLMASYPKERPKDPFPYFTEVMTGFEYTAAVGMLYEGMLPEGLEAIADIRARYDGLRRNPFDEAECGHHYARAMTSWAAVLALTGFEFSGVRQAMAFSPVSGAHFWSNGHTWGTCRLTAQEESFAVELEVLNGTLRLREFSLKGYGTQPFEQPLLVEAGQREFFAVRPSRV